MKSKSVVPMLDPLELSDLEDTLQEVIWHCDIGWYCHQIELSPLHHNASPI